MFFMYVFPSFSGCAKVVKRGEDKKESCQYLAANKRFNESKTYLTIIPISIFLRKTFMAFFGLFKKRPVIHDEDFGEMRFYNSKKEADQYFEADGRFKPTDTNVEYLIPAPATGPSAEQRSFLRQLTGNYTGLIEKMKPLIREEFRDWKENFSIVDFNKEFTPEAITIPDFRVGSIAWDICFTTTHDKNHWVIVNFIDFEPQSVLIDG
jgi:hypothetical protein